MHTHKASLQSVGATVPLAPASSKSTCARSTFSLRACIGGSLGLCFPRLAPQPSGPTFESGKLICTSFFWEECFAHFHQQRCSPHVHQYLFIDALLSPLHNPQHLVIPTQYCPRPVVAICMRQIDLHPPNNDCPTVSSFLMDQSRAHGCRWTHWGLNPGPPACLAGVMPLHHVPRILVRKIE